MLLQQFFGTDLVVASQRNTKSKKIQIGWLRMCLAMIILPASASVADIIVSGGVSPNDPSTWTSTTYGLIGYGTDGCLTVNKGSDIISGWGYMTWSADKAEVTIDGTGSTWTNVGRLFVGFKGDGILNISNGGLVSVGDGLYIPCGGSTVNMQTGGMLALKGKADDSIQNFLDLVSQTEQTQSWTDAIQYWDDETSSWRNIENAIQGEDYTLNYLTSGDLAGYTLLTVMAVPEPLTVSLLAMFGAIGLLRRR